MLFESVTALKVRAAVADRIRRTLERLLFHVYRIVWKSLEPHVGQQIVDRPPKPKNASVAVAELLGLPTFPRKAAEQSPLVSRLQHIDEDPLETFEPMSDDPPFLRGWDGEWYPRFEHLDSIRAWLKDRVESNGKRADRKYDDSDRIRYREETGTEIPPDDIPDVRDAHRIVRYLVETKAWKNPPVEPVRDFVDDHSNGQVFNDVAAELQEVLDWINECLQDATAPAEIPAREATPASEPVLTVQTWEDLGIGIDLEKDPAEYWAIASPPDRGSVFQKSKAVRLPISEKQNQMVSLLQQLAESQYGNQAKKKDLLIDFRYVLAGAMKQGDVEELTGDEQSMEEFSPGARKLSSTISDLARNIKRMVGATEPGTDPILSAASDNNVTSRFTARILFKDASGTFRFGRR